MIFIQGTKIKLLFVLEIPYIQVILSTNLYFTDPKTGSQHQRPSEGRQVRRGPRAGGGVSRRPRGDRGPATRVLHHGREGRDRGSVGALRIKERCQAEEVVDLCFVHEV